uniref:Trafficking protein particle complex subunit 10 isoform X3 n=1 Tax=Geotrypetes seraphini TaxID=260995 RepID=A0A6P8QL36_GEOSA|nr:trafficking protein particle complex subunit 10 isoform X3 [Geotrypetes seraphini]
MENKPIVTCAGDQNLFTSVYPTLSQQLPREPMEWRRSYGRAPKMIHLESNFVQFKEELLPKEGNKALLTFPFLHIYWTECCDTEIYKASAKDDITKWQNILKVHSSADWLIVVVESEAKKKNKTNILPRTSIVDKIRNDFCNKQSDRCVVLSDPLKDSSRSQESWNAFLTKLRTLLLMSFTKNLGKFEDDMRTLREKRTDPGWSFCDYFMVQEELAFVFEMLQQFEDALVQYDELDALFSQYVVNFGAGDGANWLSSFCQPVRSWDGLILRKPIDMEKRDLIQKREVTLLDLRSYLFSRQCTLLIFLQRPWEVAHRALQLLHNCVQELKLLEVFVPLGALDCWVFLSCLEVLQRIEGCCEQAQIEANLSHMVGLWSYATEKLKSLGYLCGLVSENAPNSEDLNRTVDLLAGLGAERPETASTAQSPYKKLKEALSSVEAFEKHYLDLSHATIEMYTSIGRIRSAQLIGKDLAEFYMRKKDPQKAETYLQEALKTYLVEGWALPIAHTRKQLAECQKQLGQTEKNAPFNCGHTVEFRGLKSPWICPKSCFNYRYLDDLSFRMTKCQLGYLQTSSLLAGDAHLTEEERSHFCQEILKYANQQMSNQGSKVLLALDSLAQLKNLHFEPPTAVVHVGGTLSVEVTLWSQMPVAVCVDQISLNVHFNIEKNSYRKTAEWLTKHKTSNGIINFQNEVLGLAVSRQTMPAVELYEMHEKNPSDSSLNTSGVICKNTHMLLRWQESSTFLETPTPLSLNNSANTLKRSSVTLQPGLNTVTFSTQAKEAGTYTLRQLAASVGRLQFMLAHIYPLVQYDVYSQEPQLKVQPLTGSLLAGIPQKVKFTVTTGHYTIKNGDTLQLSNADAMPIVQPTEVTATIYSNSQEKCLQSTLTIQSSEKVTSIVLPPTPAYHVIEFELEVICHLPTATAEGVELVNGEVPKSRDWQRNESCMATSDQKISIDCPWSIYSTIIVLTFSIPFKAEHTLLSAGRRKYIQICVQNLSDLHFQLLDNSLRDTCDCVDLQLLPLNARLQQIPEQAQPLEAKVPDLEKPKPAERQSWPSVMWLIGSTFILAVPVLLWKIIMILFQHIYSKQSVFFVWELVWSKEHPLTLQCCFSVTFCPVSLEKQFASLKPFSYEFQVDHIFSLYSVKADIFPPLGAEYCQTGSLCSLEVSIMRLSELQEVDKDEALMESNGYCTTKLLYEVVDNSSNWAVCGKSSGVISMPVAARATHKVHMEVMPLFAGYLPFPDIRLFKYLPHHSAHSLQLDADSWIENDNLSIDKNLDEQADNSSIKSRGSIHSSSSSDQKGLPMPRLQAFSSAQVFNSSTAMQILVIPNKDDRVLEVNVT